jgi:CrcB protein
MSYFLIFIGGGLGSVVRFAFSKFIQLQPGGFPTATLAANLVSSLILGLLLGYHFNKQVVNDSTRLFIATGFCGGFSTFSTFSYETFMLVSTGNLRMAIVNLTANFVMCYIAVAAGFLITRFL